MLLDKRKDIKPKFKTHNLVSITDLTRIFSKGDSINWSHRLYTITEITIDTLPSYHIDNLPELYNEAKLKRQK